MSNASTVEQQIDERIGEVRTDSFDMSFGEIVNLHQNHELIIQPEYQRLFRWSDNQKSSLIESILLELPVPQIFVIENQDGVFELIDGLQRISSVIQFLSPVSLELEPLILSGCSLIPALNSSSLEALPLSLKLRIKRSTIRMVVIRKQSQGFLRYEMFKRLNTGGSNLEPQEIRNCSARMIGENGVKFYSFLVELAKSEHFSKCASFLPDPVLEQKGDEELVLRYLATKNAKDDFKGSVKDWLDAYMEKILLSNDKFQYEDERTEFLQVFQCAYEKLGEAAFVRYRENKPVGSLAPAYFEAIAIAIRENLDHIRPKNPDIVRDKITDVIQSEEFRRVTGPGANSKEKLKSRIELVANSLGSL
ncbi:DUF262 domain-containing protein [uncultured Rubinisphaera sp.]|uniref:DUF262 domain-containing protein n=1 Tax=uncultured Rubinisphaera sp. TaxID=1678686 RepID=UPI0030DD64CF|tara:strand:+ start:1186 stop:2274 length:1089 start_codon:yes stop_codon:yes gene_type:complete